MNPAFPIFPYINQLLKVCPRNTGSVEVSGSIPLGSFDEVFFFQTATLIQRLVLSKNRQKNIPYNVWLVYQCLDFLTGDPLVWKKNQQEQWAFGKEKAKANYSF